jgi:hypothetical protein
MDGDRDAVERIRADPYYWSWGVIAEHAFVTRENVNSLLTTHGFSGDISILSVDVDGNDYWIFDAITAARPAIAVVEYNHRFGPERSVSIPYDANYVRRQTDASYIGSGASLAAIVNAANRKGLAFVGCASFGNNAFFVRDELRPDWMRALSPAEGFVAGRFREPLIIDGSPTFLTAAQEQELISQVELVEVP